MRLSALSIGLMCLMALQWVCLSDASAQGRKKRGHPKRNNGQAAETEAPSTASEENEEAASEGEGDAEASEGEDEGKSKSINDRLKEDESGGLRRPGRMEFDERLIKGQAAKSGAVYLFKRIPRHLPGLVPMRRSYRSRIVEPILGAVPLKPARYSYEISEKDKKAILAEEAKTEDAASGETAAAASEPAQTASADGETGTDEASEEAPAPTKKRKRK